MLEMKMEIDPTIPQWLMLDEIRLRQILFNLVGNAVKFTDSGYIKLSVENKIKEDDSSSLDLMFSVQDTGVGIDDQQKEYIFEAFRQQKGQDTSKFGGTGLGLAISKRLVTLMEGEIGIKSEPNKGSTFWFTVKLKIGDAQHLEESEILKNQRVLIVDDLLATGGTARAVADLIQKVGGTIAGIAFLIELKDLKGIKKLKDYSVYSLIKF